MQDSVCQTYAVDYGKYSAGVYICLKQTGQELLAGTIPAIILTDSAFVLCPSNTTSCVNDTSWEDNFNSVLKVTITQYRASVAYSLVNDTIVDVFDLADPMPANYGPNDFFPIFDMACTNETGDPEALHYLYFVAADPVPGDPNDNQFMLMSFMTVPVKEFNDQRLLRILDNPENANSVALMAKPSYRV